MTGTEREPPFPRPLHPATLLLRELMVSQGELERAHADALEVNAVDYRAMSMLLGRGAASPGDLAAELGLSPSATSNVIDRLISVGHVERHRDTEDGRRMVITARPASRQRALAGILPIIERAEQAARALTPDQQEALVAYLTAMNETLAGVLTQLTADPVQNGHAGR